jgi:hypothetical protein
MVLALVLALATQSAPVPVNPPGDRPALAPGARYDPRIPTLEQVVGHEIGEEITAPDEILAYLKALHDAAPDRTRLVEYARSWQGRPLHVFVIASPARMARLDAIKHDLRRLADPRTLAPGEGERLVRELPVVVALLHGVHGNEISSSGAALAEAWHLLAAQDDPAVELIRRDAIVLIDPSQNPDGRARFLLQTREGRASVPDPEAVAAEHDEPWPGGRSNHYLFDLNRDWFAQTQPESAGRVKALLDWMPHVVVDLHEMGGESTYYFPPAAEPGNPFTTEGQRTLMDVFGRATAARFDARGFPYFTREIFDSFYPGYGASWPLAHGALGMTFEKASARGLVYRRQDGTLLTYWDGVVEHFTAAMATAETAARHREQVLREFLKFRQSAIAEGARGGGRHYVLAATTDEGQVERLGAVLVKNGIEVWRAEEPLRVGARTLPAGTLIVPAAQPAGRLLRILLDQQVEMAPEFVARQDERRKRRLPTEIYDVTAWSLPLLYDVECLVVSRAPTGRHALLADPAPLRPTPPPGRVGYLLPWNASAAAAVVEALALGVQVRFTPDTFTLDGRRYARGTAILRGSDNGDGLASTVASLRERHRMEVVPIDSAYVEEGASLGGDQVRPLKVPRVLLAWDAPVQSLSAGWARYVLERRYGQRTSAVRVGSLARVDLTRFDVVVLPAGHYSPALDAEDVRRLRDWMTAGGTLVTLGEASRWAAREGVALLATRTELRGGAPEADTPPARTEAPALPPDPESAILPRSERPESVPGAILRVVLDREHWLTAGLTAELPVVVQGQRVFTPVTLDKGRNVGVYARPDRLLASGIVWDEAKPQLGQKGYLIHQPVGRGHLIAFAEEPNFRGFAEGSQLLFMNAVLLGAAY